MQWQLVQKMIHCLVLIGFIVSFSGCILSVSPPLDFALEYSQCPTGFVVVPGNSSYGTTDFCVAKYEMKALDLSVNAVDSTGGSAGALTPLTNYRAVSVTSGRPWVNIQRSDADAECAEQGWSLITNAQWMTMLAILRQIQVTGREAR